MSWLSHLGNQVGIATIGHKFHIATHTKTHNRHSFRQEKLGILAFEAASTMSRLVSLYKSLSEDEVLKLRKEIMRSEGVRYLNSTDEGFLLRLAFEERMEDLDRAAMAVSRFGKKCSVPELSHFENVYAEMKLGLGKVEFTSKEIERVIEKIEKLISTTATLFSALEALSEMEVSERRVTNRSRNKHSHNSDDLNQKLSWQRQHVQNLKHFSLWNQTFDKTVALMARTVCVLYARICVVFGPYVSLLPSLLSRSHARCVSMQIQCHPFADKPLITSKSGPIPNPDTEQDLIWFWCRESKPLHSECTDGVAKKIRLSQQAPASTLGGSGLALRYANVIILAEKFLRSPCSISRYDRENIYQMLPESLSASVKLKLRKLWRKDLDDSGWWEDGSLAEGWRDGLKVIFGWLGPMAHDTVRCLMERSYEKQSFETKPTVLLLQTLYFADREKTEAAIAEVLVGLSCICRYEIHCSFGCHDR